MFCRNCGAEMNDNQAVCIKCGVEKNNGSAFCPNCGNEVSELAAFCVSCGVSLKETPKNESNNPNYLRGQNKNTISLVCFFLGWLGIHNFMMQENKKGLTKLICSFMGMLFCMPGLLAGIFAIIDFIKILQGTYVVDSEKFI